MKSRFVKLLLGFLAHVACVLAMTCPVESQVVNGGFENNIIDSQSAILESSMLNWVLTQGADTTIRGQDSGSSGVPWGLAPHTGSIAAVFSSTASATEPGASITQSLSGTTPTKTYNLAFWVANPIQDAGNFSNVLSVSWDGALITLSGPSITEVGTTKTYVVNPNTAWFQVTATNLPVTGTSTNLVITARNNDWATLVDDVSVVETPEPSTVVMLCAGTALLGFRRRRRQGSI